MIERAIEHWLTSTNERNYKTAFAQVLAHQGFSVLTVPADGPMEQGKDLITLDPEGRPCGFQLKTGALDLATWRRYREEMMELIQLPIYHPAVDKTMLHRAILVTNGEMTNEVRVQIDQINEDNLAKGRKYARLEVITLQPLLKSFVEAQGQFIPRELDDLRSFLDIYQADGSDFFPVEKFAALVDQVFLAAKDRPAETRNAVSSSLVFTSYLLHPFQLKANHFAAFEAWATLGACILRLALERDLKADQWQASFELIKNEMARNLLGLRSEALERPDFLEGNWLGDGGAMHAARALITLGAAAALTSHFKRQGPEDKDAAVLLEKIRTNKDYLKTLWGESAFPFLFHIVLFLEASEEGELALELLSHLFEGIIDGYSRDSKTSAPSLYYKPAEALGAAYGLVEEDLDLRQFSGRSMILRPVLEMLARRDQRDIIAKHWRRLSWILFKEFSPDKVEDVFAWRTDSGQTLEAWPEESQSWKSLQDEAHDLSSVPEPYQKYADFLALLVLVYPHRCTPTVIRALDRPVAANA